MSKIEIIYKNPLNKKELSIVNNSFNNDLSIVAVYHCKLIEFLIDVFDYDGFTYIRKFTNIDMKYHDSNNYIFAKAVINDQFLHECGYKTFYKNGNLQQKNMTLIQ